MASNGSEFPSNIELNGFLSTFLLGGWSFTTLFPIVSTVNFIPIVFQFCKFYPHSFQFEAIQGHVLVSIKISPNSIKF